MEEKTPRAVSVSVLKGGVGKSTIAGNLAETLAHRGNTVLFMDLDSNGHASAGLGFEDHYENYETHLGDVLFNTANPSDVIFDTGFGFDILPATDNHSSIENQIKETEMPSLQLKNNLIDPLLNNEYDYIIVDNSGDKSTLLNNTLVAAQNIIMPLTPGEESLHGLQRTKEDLLKPLREYIDLNILAIVPNRLSRRIDYHYGDRKLVEAINRGSPSKVPNFARIPAEDWNKMDNGDWQGKLPKPGIRENNEFTEAYGREKPLREYNPNNPELENLEELAQIVERGGVNHDG
ncbi:ParA family protein [Halodesulfurarchaeum sp. HSR-GB]|uniref:ParA family protein n=1 Tax=Halodesulfurarchaeum sp. HSR-GB TaxID=3074077 RepID=UPI0028601F7A|nr:ParA family protein [Halodesulfurarchaeum sp. HSR-GB]MDR5657688.1 ParA family protein [Halodesulfurarchaeum sp. HSR-GB]